MDDMQHAREYHIAITREIFEMQEAARRDIERITGIENLDGTNLQGEKESRWQRFNDSVAALRQQQAAMVRAMTAILAMQPVPPMLITKAPAKAPSPNKPNL